MLCVLIRIASMRRFLSVHTTYFYFEATRKDDQIILLDLIGSNYPCFEKIFIVPKVFEPLKPRLYVVLTCGLRYHLSEAVVNGGD